MSSSTPTATLFPYTTLFRSGGRVERGLQPCASASSRRLGGLRRGPQRAHAGGRRRRSAAGKRHRGTRGRDRNSTRLNSSHQIISYAVFCLKKNKRRVINRPE